MISLTIFLLKNGQEFITQQLSLNFFPYTKFFTVYMSAFKNPLYSAIILPQESETRAEQRPLYPETDR